MFDVPHCMRDKPRKILTFRQVSFLPFPTLIPSSLSLSPPSPLPSLSSSLPPHSPLLFLCPFLPPMPSAASLGAETQDLFALKAHFLSLWKTGQFSEKLKDFFTTENSHLKIIIFFKGEKGRNIQLLGEGTSTYVPFCHAIALLNSYLVNSYVNDILSSLIASVPTIDNKLMGCFLPLNLSIF